ncbi:MAG: hypothetical protein LBM87_04705 [Ruminococcus sp.]|jgi:cell division septum initiation protein DivIVA|nr:hypothetical protein [Ruminococcus sp.]
MEGTGFLKTVNFGGFDKKDVLAYVDELNTKIYTLEAELDEKKQLLDASGGTAGSEKYEELLKADKTKITELQTSNDSLKIQLQSTVDELKQKEAEVLALKSKNTALEDELATAKQKAAAGGESNAMDLSQVFMEAQKSANSIVSQAKENARKMDEDAKKLANQVVDDANGKASTIVKQADERASRILTEAEDKTAEMRAQAEAVKASITTQMTDLGNNLNKLREVIISFSDDSDERIKEAVTIVNKTHDVVSKGEGLAPVQRRAAPPKRLSEIVPSVSAAEYAPAPKVEEAPKVEAAPEPVKQEAPKKPEPPKSSNKFGFDLSELENLTKMVEGSAANDGF